MRPASANNLANVSVAEDTTYEPKVNLNSFDTYFHSQVNEMYFGLRLVDWGVNKYQRKNYNWFAILHQVVPNSHKPCVRYGRAIRGKGCGYLILQHWTECTMQVCLAFQVATESMATESAT